MIWNRKILSKIPKYIHDSIMILYWWIRSRFVSSKQNYKGAWLICERGIEARDNGFAFFQFLRTTYPTMKVYYLIDCSQKLDYEKVKPYGNIIQYNSVEHRKALFYAECVISTHIGYVTPWSYVCHKTFFSWLDCPKFILLNHGITKEDVSDKLNKFVTGVDLLIAANQHDYNMLINPIYGYKLNEVALTGYARYDNWKVGEEKNQILFMPTWRTYLISKKNSKKNSPSVINSFTDTLYFQAILKLLNSPKLNELLKQYNMQLIFYPHYEMQSALPLFSFTNDNIIIADKQHNDIPQLMKESKIMITDYSGVGFDFAYMYKPVLYYQFDKEEYYKGHYLSSSEYSLEKKGLGPVLTTQEHLLDELENILSQGCKMTSLYKRRTDEFFTFHDTSNCKRIYESIIKLL